MGSDLTEEIVKQIGSVKSEPFTFFEGRLVNYTPYAAGDYDTRSFRCINYECFPTRALLAQQLRGRMRWLARITLAGLYGCRKPDLTYDYVDSNDNMKSNDNEKSKCFPVRIHSSKNSGKVLEMSLIEFMFGTLKARESRKGGHQNKDEPPKTSFSSPFKLQVELSYDGSSYYDLAWSPKISATIASRIGNRLLDRHHTIAKDKSAKPIKPEKVKLTLKIQIDPFVCQLDGTLGDRSLKKLLPDIALFYANLALATLSVFGVGKTVNRGFGRFKPLDHNSLHFTPFYCDGKVVRVYRETEPHIMDSVVTVIPDLIQARDNREALNSVRRLLESLIRDAARITGTEFPPSWQLARIPSLVSATYGYYNNSPTPEISGVKVVTLESVKTIDDAIELIAHCVLKRSLARMRGLRRSDLERVAWVLGLPRGRRYRGKGLPGRRQSMIVLFPLPNPKHIVLVPLLAKDGWLEEEAERDHRIFKDVYDAVESCLKRGVGRMMVDYERVDLAALKAYVNTLLSDVATSGSIGKPTNPKKNALRRILEYRPGGKSAELLGQAVKAASRLMQEIRVGLAGAGYHVAMLTFLLNSPGLAGMGSGLFKSTFEVGLTIDPVLGLPYYPGSSIKGAVRGYSEALIDDNDWRDFVRLLFGETTPKSSVGGHVGIVFFSDMLPVGCVKRVCSIYRGLVVTPHYVKRGSIVKDESEAMPIPVVHVGVEEGTVFQLVLGVAPGDYVLKAHEVLKEIIRKYSEKGLTPGLSNLASLLSQGSPEYSILLATSELVREAFSAGIAARSSKGYNVFKLLSGTSFFGDFVLRGYGFHVEERRGGRRR